jgi:transposase
MGVGGAADCASQAGGNKRTVDVREVVNSLMYVLSTGCQWRAIPKHLPPRSTVHDYFDLWAWDGTLDRIHHALYVRCRELARAPPSSTVKASPGGRGSTSAGKFCPFCHLRARVKNARPRCRQERTANALRGIEGNMAMRCLVPRSEQGGSAPKSCGVAQLNRP